MSIVIFLNDSLGKREAETPSALLRGEAGGENVFPMALGDAFAGIRNVDADFVARRNDVGRNAARAIHGIDGILEQVFHHPLKERAVHGHLNRMVRVMTDDGNAV